MLRFANLTKRYSDHHSRVFGWEIDMIRIIGIALASSVLIASVTGASAQEARRGAYLAMIMDCAGCHTPGAFVGKPDGTRPLAGSEIGFQIPGLGIFNPPNLTPHAETGLGKWSESDIIKAVRTGTRPDGRQLAPAMPWRAYAALTDADAKALAGYLKSLKAVDNRIPGPTGPTEKPNGPYLTVVVPQ
jgi:mono/diheme cytochrome c family protein